MTKFIVTEARSSDRTSIYGIGETAEAAHADALEWIDGDKADPTLIALPCTERLFDRVRDGDPDGPFAENAEGLQDIIA